MVGCELQHVLVGGRRLVELVLLHVHLGEREPGLGEARVLAGRALEDALAFGPPSGLDLRKSLALGVGLMPLSVLALLQAEDVRLLYPEFGSRLLPIVRTFISFPAGVLRTNFPRFVLYTFVGSFIWCAALALGGYLFGARWEELRALMRPFDIPIALVILAAGAWYVYHHVKNFREQSVTPPVNAEREA